MKHPQYSDFNQQSIKMAHNTVLTQPERKVQREAPGRSRYHDYSKAQGDAQMARLIKLTEVAS